MEPRRFMVFRAAFAGVPFGALEAATRRMDAGQEWTAALLGSAMDLRQLADQASREGRARSAAQAWLWTASTYQAASLGLHLVASGTPWWRSALRLRHRARLAYRRALALQPGLGRAVRLATPRGPVTGYLRLPATGPAPLVVLFNGLDSLCEVELHAFGEPLLARGMAVLALDLPAAFGARPRTPLFEVEAVAPALADWAARQPGLVARGLGALGVSFGGHLVARALAGEPRFVAGVAVSPNAGMDGPLMALERMRRMLSLSFNLRGDAEVEGLASRIHLGGLKAPEGRLLLLHMEQDRLFGPEHAEAFVAWGGSRVELRTWNAEHVGTSRVHEWLPQSVDWLLERIKAADPDVERTTNTWGARK
ncbi:alpha/beta hydrolase family protein [Corallococcus silvisoli]|uniref:alpha/beta hydrolase family protein n=1 Tax=Corallococcus silvisoli TaxID=2697031 RepID=UPI001379067E|nr:alpha/beta hydrolase [Corallococcus silvisoli]NBD07543.1 alpha/beta hydrolase [Corallococcus silvisoli]